MIEYDGDNPNIPYPYQDGAIYISLDGSHPTSSFFLELDNSNNDIQQIQPEQIALTRDLANKVITISSGGHSLFFELNNLETYVLAINPILDQSFIDAMKDYLTSYPLRDRRMRCNMIENSILSLTISPYYRHLVLERPTESRTAAEEDLYNMDEDFFENSVLRVATVDSEEVSFEEARAEAEENDSDLEWEEVPWAEFNPQGLILHPLISTSSKPEKTGMWNKGELADYRIDVGDGSFCLQIQYDTLETNIPIRNTSSCVTYRLIAVISVATDSFDGKSYTDFLNQIEKYKASGKLDESELSEIIQYQIRAVRI